MKHISNPICNSISKDSIAQIIKKDMGDSNIQALKVKNMILESLNKN